MILAPLSLGAVLGGTAFVVAIAVILFPAARLAAKRPRVTPEPPEAP